ncbi:hypothetical protein [Streptomyces sp. NPDC001642]|uniref:hypothetical protein n=1 Tax=Streptomyces sp. NPDC001642 TaxID=3154392 RepID=UPI00332D8DE1
MAVPALDGCQAANGFGATSPPHWGLTQFLPDGHHELEAAAGAGGRWLTRLGAVVTEWFSRPPRASPLAAQRVGKG